MDSIAQPSPLRFTGRAAALMTPVVLAALCLAPHLARLRHPSVYYDDLDRLAEARELTARGDAAPRVQRAPCPVLSGRHLGDVAVHRPAAGERPAGVHSGVVSAVPDRAGVASLARGTRAEIGRGGLGGGRSVQLDVPTPGDDPLVLGQQLHVGRGLDARRLARGGVNRRGAVAARLASRRAARLAGSGQLTPSDWLRARWRRSG